MEDLFSGSPPALDLAPRPGSLARDEVLARAARIALPAPRRRLLQGLAMLWHDRWEDAHAVAQSQEGQPDYDLLHAIGHRREGDFANSKYWFRSAGAHPCFPAIGRAVSDFLPEGAELRRALLPGGKWSPPSFVDAVAGVLGRRSGRAAEADSGADLVRIQAIEVRCFAEWLESA